MKRLRLHTPLQKRSLIYFAVVLFLLSFATNYFFQLQPSINYQQKILQKYVTEQQQDAKQLLSDTAILRKLVLNEESMDEFQRIYNKQYGFFLFAETLGESQDLLFWNNQKIVPPEVDFNLADGSYFQKLPNGYYVVMKRTLRFPGMTNNILTYILIPVLYKYYLETDYLQTQFAHNADATRKITLSQQPTAYPIRMVDSTKPFYIKRLAHTSIAGADTVTVILRLIGLLFIMIFLQLQAESIIHKRSIWQGIGFLALTILVIRILTYVFPALFSLRQFSLFDPSVYATNWLNRSLGDLLLNAFFLCWVVVFTWNNTNKLNFEREWLKNKKGYLAGVAAIFFLIMATFQFARVVYSLVTDSKISFNVTDFFSLNIYTLFGFIVLAVISLTYYYFSRLLYRFIFHLFKKHIYIYFAIATIGLLYLSFSTGHRVVLFELPVLLWLVIYTFLLSHQNFVINRLRFTVAGFLFWIFIFSASLSLLILEGNKETEILKRQAIAEKFHQLTDPSSEKILSIAMGYIDNRFLVRNFDRFKDPDENRHIRDSIITENFRGYYRYDTKIYVFDSANNPVNNDDPTPYADLNTIYTSQSKPTLIPDLYYHEMSFDRFAYITRRLIRDTSGVLGSFFIISTPRQYSGTDAFYPELFRQVNQKDVENSPVYSYAIYVNNLLINSSAKYPFPITLSQDQLPQNEFERRSSGDYDELWYRAARNKVVIVAKKQDQFIESITVFSYLFCAFLFMVGFLQLLSLLLQLIRNPGKLNLLSSLSIRTQIHGTVILVSVFSFIIIGIATISFFIDRYERNNIDRLSRTASIAVKEIQKNLADKEVFADNVNIYDSLALVNLGVLVNEIADIHNVDVNLYDLEGNLQVTSDEDVYKKGVLSSKMHPWAFYHLSNLREVQRVQVETMSRLKYLSIYTTIRDEKGRVYGYLNIPYFSSQLDLNQEISNFLVTIINLNAFIFLIAGIIALFITNKITASFSVISERMRQIRVGGSNEEIVWSRDDEIGELVKQYNKMVHQLEQSAAALAKSEREGAWREMARQVAHEIKNPLTPMKLSIQYLQRAILNDKENVQELTANVANTLIEQIEHLSKIAADFSQFANIGNKTDELVDLHQILHSLVALYKSNPKVEISWEKLSPAPVMLTDKTQMNRLFTNLFANAVEACSARSRCAIYVFEERKNGTIIIGIRDNGEGIPAAMRTKIFIPNFTTKTSGTGLGLAMCKSIVEQAGGSIWFETVEKQGTTFFVQLPLVN